MKMKMGSASHQDWLIWRNGPRWVIRLVETKKFDVEFVSIRVRMQLLGPPKEVRQEGPANPETKPD